VAACTFEWAGFWVGLGSLGWFGLVWVGLGWFGFFGFFGFFWVCVYGGEGVCLSVIFR